MLRLNQYNKNKLENRNMKLTKMIGFVGVLLLLLMLSIQISFAQLGNVLILLDNEGDVMQIQPYYPNNYYLSQYYFGVSPDGPSSANSSTTLFSEYETIRPLFLDSNTIIFKDVDFEDSYTLTIEREVYPLYFCNNNNKCETCEDGNCAIFENSLTCPNDCATGGDDSYCDLQLDGVCDPDCPDMDFDCESCSGSACTYEGKIEPKTTCKGIDGTICSVTERCDGKLTYTDDAGAFCCIGTCYDKEIKIPLKTKQPTEKDSVSEKTDANDFSNAEDELDEMNKTVDLKIFFYIVILIVFLLLSVVAVVIFETKAIKKEHKIRNYVYDLMRKGYPIEQIRTSLVQQNVDTAMIRKIMRQYRK